MCSVYAEVQLYSCFDLPALFLSVALSSRVQASSHAFHTHSHTGARAHTRTDARTHIQTRARVLSLHTTHTRLEVTEQIAKAQ